MEKIPQGTQFNDWTVIKEVDGRYGRRFLCQNSVGKKQEVNLVHLRSGKSKGYYGRGEHGSNYKHGMSKSRFWNVWQGMLRRCDDKNQPAYKNYGGRGIKVCPKWLKFQGFYEDMISGYTSTMTIERIDVDGDYCPENCKWIPKGEQQHNTRRNHNIEYQGKNYKLFELAEKFNIKYQTLYNRIYTYKMPLEKALKNVSYKYKS